MAWIRRLARDLWLELWYGARLCAAFAWDLVLSSVAVARVVVSRDAATAPRFVSVPLMAGCSDLEIALIANYITLTPGTLSVDVSADRRRLLVHCLDAGDGGAGICADVEGAIGPRVLRVTRR